MALRRYRSMTGFTLLELLVAVALIATMAAVALPHFARLIEVNRVVSATNEFKTALNYARSEAVRRNARVTLAPLPSGWHNGWEVRTQNASLRQWPHENSNLQINVTNEPLDFTSLGRLPERSPTVWISIERSSQGRCIRLEPSGLSRVQDTPAACD